MIKNLLYNVIILTISSSLFFLSNQSFSQQKNSLSFTKSKYKIIYTSPVNGAEFAKPQTNIIIRTNTKIDPSSISNSSFFDIRGMKSGKHFGHSVLSSDQRTIIIKISAPFKYGERVNVIIHHGLKSIFGEDISGCKFNFIVSKRNSYNFTVPITQNYQLQNLEGLQNYKNSSKEKFAQKISSDSLPPDLPPLKVNVSNDPSDGFIFLSSYILRRPSNFGTYLIIADNQGSIVRYKKIPGIGTDFKIQPTGVITYFDEYLKKYYVLNSSLNIVDSITCGNGYLNNAHELRILPDGKVFLICDDPEKMDMSKIVEGGDSSANVIGNVIQELDEDGNVIFQWNTFDHFSIKNAEGVNLTAHTIDYAHSNAVDIDTDGNILLSTRYYNEITKINIDDGSIIWRFGGKNNQFHYLNDTIGFSYQHSVRRLKNGDIILFDNGNLNRPQYTRILEYKLNVKAKTANLVWKYVSPSTRYSYAMGNTQRLSNGNTFIEWGAYYNGSVVTEVTQDGKVAFDMSFPSGICSYRGFRFPFLVINSKLKDEKFNEGKTATLSWKSSGIKSIDIKYSIDNGTTWNNIVKNYDAGLQYYNWKIPSVESDSCKLKIVDTDDSSLIKNYYSDSLFAIQKATYVKMNSQPKKFKLFDNYPNPFNPSTIIKYELAKQSMIKIDIYNTVGQLVTHLVNSIKPAGEYETTFSGINLSSGIYFYTLKATSLDDSKEFYSVKKMILVK